MLFGNIFISLCAAAATFETYVLNRLRPNPPYVVFVFCGTLFLYNLQRVVLAPSYLSFKTSVRHEWIKNYRTKLLILSCIGFAGMILSLFRTGFYLLRIMIPAGIFSLMYFFPGIQLRKLPGLKAFVIALVWAIITAFSPVVLAYQAMPIQSLSLFYITAERIFFILPLCIIFNIRDIEQDAFTGVHTIPSLYGPVAAKAMSILCLIISFGCSFALYYKGVYGSATIIALAVSAGITLAAMLLGNEKRGEYYYLFTIDGMILLQALLVAAFNFF